MNALVWEIARAAGFTSYVLLTLAVAAGLLVSGRWGLRALPKLVTNGMHEFLTLLALVFTAVHVAAVAVDPFTHFGLGGVLVPFTAGYRPLWTALGIVSLYLLLAVRVSTLLRDRIGYRWWRRLHGLAFVLYLFATVHGLGAGSDSATPWGAAIYATSVVLVGGLTLARLLRPSGRMRQRRPLVAAAVAFAVAAGGAWAASAPLGSAADRARAATSAAPVALSGPFSGRIEERQAGNGFGVEVRIAGTIQSSPAARVELVLDGQPAGDGGIALDASRILLGTGSATYEGTIDQVSGNEFQATLAGGSQRVRLDLVLADGGSGQLAGTARVEPVES